jgi:hypothetical protein
MQLGIYNFNGLSNSNKIQFMKFIGPPRPFSENYFIPADWKKYESNGSFTIIEKTNINGHLVSKLKLNFTARYNGILEYNINNADFITKY